MSGYPADWPKCACGKPVMDGHLTCGEASCSESAARDSKLSHNVSHAAFTEADFNSWRFNRDAVHLNGGKVFFGYGHRCVTQPRLLVIDKYFKADRSQQRSYLVDGKTQCTTLPDALAALAVPPTLTSDELQLLNTLSMDWYRHPDRVTLIPLAEMGMIEWGRDAENKVTCRLTAAGAEQLTKSQRPDGPAQ